MSAAAPRRRQPPGPAVEQLADRQATGALHTETGTLYLDHGAVVHADSPHSLDLGSLLTRCGRVTPDYWQHTLDQFAEHCLVGRMLVAQGALTRGELEVCHLATLYDAGYFALGAFSLATRFEPGVRHWLGPVSGVDPRLLRREAVRRRDLLERIWPWPQVDTAPVRHTVTTDQDGTAARGLSPSPRRRELLGLADGRRTPVELARLLGRSTYATIVEVRRLAAAGLIATPPDAPDALDPHDAPAAATPLDAPTHPIPPHAPTHPIPADAMARRVPGATLRRGRAPDPPPRPAPTEPDIALLIRVRTALEARL